DLCGPSNIELTVQFDSTLTELKPDMELRRDIYLVFKEAVNNAVKYSACKRLFVSIGKQSGHLAIMIVDDGKGFDPATINKGNGLDNMRRRVTERKGSFHIESSKEKGTKITCNIPFTHFG
ncbi:MAG: hypothetical protein JNM00_09480, partial [Flavobacteriales bacterium]|nr:hypothetical protein [Flavobacteriales bacterium]